MFSAFQRRRVRKGSPDPESQQINSPSTTEPGRRRRSVDTDAALHNTNNNNNNISSGSTLLPTTFRSETSGSFFFSPKASSYRRPASQLPSFQSSGNTCNSFLLGGHYYPGKDKKRKHLRRRTMWHRVFCSSPWRMALSIIAITYVALWHVVVPATELLLHYGRILSGGSYPSSSSLLLLYTTPQSGTLDFLSLLPPLELQRRQAQRLHNERKQLQYGSHSTRHDVRLHILERIVPEWFHPDNKIEEVDDENDGIVTVEAEQQPTPETPKEQQQRESGEKVVKDESDDEQIHDKERHEGESNGSPTDQQTPRRTPKSPDAPRVRDNQTVAEEAESAIEHRENESTSPQKQSKKPMPFKVSSDAADHSSTTEEGAQRGDASGNGKPMIKSTEIIDKGVAPVPEPAHMRMYNATTSDATSLLQRTLQTMDTFPSRSSCPSQLSSSQVNTTLVVQSSPDRMWILGETCLRWKDPIIAVIHLARVEHISENDVVAWEQKCPHMTILKYHAEESEQEWGYPVNRLRNLGLDAVKTSHVLVMDMDFVPSRNLYQLIQSTILEQSTVTTESHREALVVPAFERFPPEPCVTEQDCMIHLKLNSSFLPHTLEELKLCIAASNCSVFQSTMNWEGHYSTRSESWLEGDWYESSPNESTRNNTVKKIKAVECFDSLRYEPYVVLQWCPTLSNDNKDDVSPSPRSPYYDERFYGYGKNKIQFISHLRFMGYRFSVLPGGFIVHHPHPESVAKKVWNNKKEYSLHEKMDKLYPQFLNELQERYKDVKTAIGKCTNKKHHDK